MTAVCCCSNLIPKANAWLLENVGVRLIKCETIEKKLSSVDEISTDNVLFVPAENRAIFVKGLRYGTSLSNFSSGFIYPFAQYTAYVVRHIPILVDNTSSMRQACYYEACNLKKLFRSVLFHSTYLFNIEILLIFLLLHIQDQVSEQKDTAQQCLMLF